MNADKQSELVTKLVQAWESKNAKRVARGAVLSTMALSLAACGGSSDPVVADDAADGGTTDDASDVPTTAAMSALQAQAASLISTIAASDAAVEAATLAAGSSSAVLDINDLTAAPTTAAAATTAFGALAANLAGQLTTSPTAPNGVAGNTGLESSVGLGEYAGLATTLATIITANTAVTAAQKTALATADAAFATAFGAEKAQDAADVLASSVAAFGAVATRTAAQDTAAAGLKGIANHIAANAWAVSVDGDNVAATQAESAAGIAAYANAVLAAVVANDATYGAAYALLDAAGKAAASSAAVNAVTAMVLDGDGTAIVIDQATGKVIGDGAINGAAVVGDDGTDTTNASGTYAVVAAAVSAAAPTYDMADATVGGAVNAYLANVIDQTYDASLMAAYNAMIAAAKEVVAADASSQIAAIEAGNVSTLSLGEDNIDIDGGAATSGNDVFVWSEAGGAMTIGSAATSTAPGNVLFGAGDDSVVIVGEYTFVTVATAAAQATLATTAVGDATVLEAFVYQDAATGNAVISFEENAYDGSVTTGGAMTQLTLTDVTFADLSVEAIDGYTILSHDAAVA